MADPFKPVTVAGPDARDKLIQELSDSVEFLLAERAGLQDHVSDLQVQLDLALAVAVASEKALEDAQDAVRALTPSGRAS